MANKSFYLFLTALLGCLLFFIIHRLLFFIYLYLLAVGFLTTEVDYIQFLTFEYFSLIVVLMLGVWYGIWLGLSWYKKVYEEGSMLGFVDNLNSKVFSDNSEKLSAMLERARQRLKTDEEQMRQLEQTASQSPAPITIIEQAIIGPTIIEQASTIVEKKKRPVRKTAKRKTSISRQQPHDS